MKKYLIKKNDSQPTRTKRDDLEINESSFFLPSSTKDKD